MFNQLGGGAFGIGLLGQLRSEFFIGSRELTNTPLDGLVESVLEL
jgi:hypothetical protein